MALDPLISSVLTLKEMREMTHELGSAVDLRYRKDGMVFLDVVKRLVAEKACPDEYREECNRITSYANLSRMRFAIYALFALAIYLLIMDVTLYLRTDEDVYYWFLYVDIFLFTILSVHLLFSFFKRPQSPKTIGRFHRILPFSFALLILIWAIMVTAFEHTLTGEAFTYVIAILGVSTLLLCRWTIISMIFLTSLAVFFVISLCVDNAPEALVQEYPFLIGLLIVGFIISRVTYGSYLRQFTARKRLLAVQEQLEGKNEELSQTNKRLQETQVKLIRQEKFVAIGQLAAGVAHEVNNPLGFMRSNCRTLIRRLRFLAPPDTQTDGNENGRVTDEMNDIVVEMLEGLDRIAKVVRNLLDFVRPHSGNEVEDYDIREGIESTLTIAKNSYKYTARIEKDFEDVPPIKCRGGEINQVLLNLLLNAAQAVSSKYHGTDNLGTITIRVYSKGQAVICDISNDGPPIPVSYRERIFEPFFTTKPAGEGTGLGLSIAHHIVADRHNGDLRLVESGEVTTFTLELPVKQEL